MQFIVLWDNEHFGAPDNFILLGSETLGVTSSQRFAVPNSSTHRNMLTIMKELWHPMPFACASL